MVHLHIPLVTEPQGEAGGLEGLFDPDLLRTVRKRFRRRRGVGRHARVGIGLQNGIDVASDRLLDLSGFESVLELVVFRIVTLLACLQSCHQGRTVSLAPGQRTGIEGLHNEVIELFGVFFRRRTGQLVVAVHKVGVLLPAIRVVGSLGSLVLEVHVAEIAEINVHFADVAVQFGAVQLPPSLPPPTSTSAACSTSPNSTNSLVTSPRSNISNRTMFPNTRNRS